MRQNRSGWKSKKALRKSAAPFRCRLVIMVRVPVAGRVKTRLARALGVGEALRFYRGASRAVIGRLARQPFWETMLAVAPDAGTNARAWPRHIRRFGQGGGDIGERMQRPMRALEVGPVCVIGTDVPGIEVGHVRRAFRLLGRCDAVFGPADDGGFWLIGQRRRPRVIEPYAAGVRWSTSSTLADVLANLRRYRTGLTQQLSDVDEADDLFRERRDSGRLIRCRGFESTE